FKALPAGPRRSHDEALSHLHRVREKFSLRRIERMILIVMITENLVGDMFPQAPVTLPLRLIEELVGGALMRKRRMLGMVASYVGGLVANQGRFDVEKPRRSVAIAIFDFRERRMCEGQSFLIGLVDGVTFRARVGERYRIIYRFFDPFTA